MFKLFEGLVLVGFVVLIAGCRSDIKAPPADFPVYGPYMTPKGNFVASPISWCGWAGSATDPFVVWDADASQYVMALGSKAGDTDTGSAGSVLLYQQFLLMDILESIGNWKPAYVADGHDGVWGPVREPALVRGVDGKWRLYATALSKKGDESTRREAVFESLTDHAWSVYAFKRWNAARTVVPSQIFGYDCRALVTPANGIEEILSATPFKSPDGRETWIAYSTTDPTLPAKERIPIACVQRLDFGADRKPLPMKTAGFGVWRPAPSGEPAVKVR